MAYRFSKRSQENLQGCHPFFIELFGEVIKIYDCSILEGHRTKEQHDRYRQSGLTQISYEESGHSKVPSLACHAMPYPIDWKDEVGITYFAGIVMGIAHTLEFRLCDPYLYDLRWGGDWDQDFSLKNNNFDDLAHYELIKKGD